MRLKATFSCNKGVSYDVAVNAVFPDEYNETLDSGTILLCHVPNNDRISLIEPYNFVKITDEENADFIKYFAVDSFSESPENISLGIKQYNINLMSMTKFLEKIQLPNRTINHNIVNGVNVYKTLAQVIDETMLLYCPKIKITTDNTTWHYDYIFTWSNVISDSKLNIPCKDFSLSQPTLRTMLTVLMTQAGLLPRLNNRDLGYIDLNAENHIFSISDYQTTKKERSMSSDSYINTLVNMGEKILDTSNYVYSENIGFRDRENVFLKQKENLILNTTLPIYNVKKLIMNSYMKGTLLFHNMAYPLDDNSVPYINNVTWTIPANHELITAVLSIVGISTTAQFPYTASSIQITLLKSNIRGGYDYRETINIFNTITFTADEQSKTISSLTTSTDWDTASIRLTMTSSDSKTSDNYFASWIGNSLNSEAFKDIYYNFSYDISRLCVENNKRHELDTNYLNMQNVSNIDELAQYIYGTVTYNIGDTKITGFSQMYSVARGWWSVDKTYIENIFTQCQKFSDLEHKPFGSETDIDYILNFYGGLPTQYISYFNDTNSFMSWNTDPIIYSPSGSKSYANMFFSISYQPMNTLNIKYSKNTDIPFSIEQLDTQESAISSLDDLANNETDKINRLGNDILSISQVTSNYNEIQPLNSIIDGHIVFKREISVGLNAYYVNYYASKDYVIKNYFTAIQTKYRAYQYASYESSVVRKENTKIFLEISNSYYNGGDKVEYNGTELLTLIQGITTYNTDKSIEYAVEYLTKDNIYKNDLSISTYKNNMIFSSQDFDNVSQGIYIQNNAYTEQLGGIPQSWYIWDSAFNTAHSIAFIGKVDYINPNTFYNTSAQCDNACNNIYIAPKLYGNFDNVSAIMLYKRYYKDVYELLNNTLQIEVYSDTENAIFSSWLLRLSGIIPSEYGNVQYYIAENWFESQDNEIDITKISNLEENISAYITLSHMSVAGYSTIVPYITLNWINNIASMTVIVKIRGKYYEVASFKKHSENISETYYFSVNDTKTHKVYEEYNGLLCPDEEIQTGTLQRLIK